MSEKREQRAVEMRILLARWQKSGLSMKNFAVREGVAYTTLTYWRSRELKRGASRPLRKAARPSQPKLAPVKVIGAPGMSEGYEIRLRNGVEVGVRPGFESEELSRLLTVVGQC